MNHLRKQFTIALMLLMPVLVITTSTGCLSQVAKLLYVIKGTKVPAAFPGLEEKRVAVVCISDQTAYGPDKLTYTIADLVSRKLKQGVKEIELVSSGKIEEWIDQNSWDNQDILGLGDGVNADLVIEIEIGSYSLREGSTLFKGQTELTVTVFDLEKGGDPVYVYGPEDYVFPKDGRPAIQTNERKFEQFYLARLTERISRLFIGHDRLESFADDASIIR